MYNSRAAAHSRLRRRLLLVSLPRRRKVAKPSFPTDFSPEMRNGFLFLLRRSLNQGSLTIVVSQYRGLLVSGAGDRSSVLGKKPGTSLGGNARRLYLTD